jgi:putative SbcD/Mre11-related phosphoesterase
MKRLEPHQIELFPGIVADGRRALWFKQSQTLVLSDLHLGYAWSHRKLGQLLPLCGDDQILDTFRSLIEEFRPRKTLFLGDIVHATVQVDAVITTLKRLFQMAESTGELVLVRGNHDMFLEDALRVMGTPYPLHSSVTVESWHLHHGHQELEVDKKEDARQVIGHEHPAYQLPDGPQPSQRLPCFLVARTIVVLPAFSPWAAGVPLGRSPFLGPVARASIFNHAIVCFGTRLLAFPLDRGSDETESE